MAQERELAPAQTAQVDQGGVDEPWPVSFAIVVVTVVSVALWSLIMLAADWLIG